MSQLAPELASLPTELVLDGELVAWEDGCPSFPRLCERLLFGRRFVPLTYVAFDVLAVDGYDVMRSPYQERRRLREELELDVPHVSVPESLEDGEALFAAVQEHGLEGVMAKKLSEPYGPGERSWVKRKNREYWRYPMEREAAITPRASRARRTSSARVADR